MVTSGMTRPVGQQADEGLGVRRFPNSSFVSPLRGTQAVVALHGDFGL